LEIGAERKTCLVGKGGDAPDGFEILLRRELLVLDAVGRGDGPRGSGKTLDEFFGGRVERGDGVERWDVPDVCE
jgi:hypothetical protein